MSSCSSSTVTSSTAARLHIARPDASAAKPAASAARSMTIAEGLSQTLSALGTASTWLLALTSSAVARPLVPSSASVPDPVVAQPAAHPLLRGVDPFLQDTLNIALQRGVNQFLFLEAHGDSMNLAIVAQMAAILRNAGKHVVLCREINPDLPYFGEATTENIAEPHVRADAVDWLATLFENREDTAPTADREALALFETVLSSADATPCTLRFLAGREDMNDFIRLGTDPSDQRVYLGGFGGAHGLEKWVDGWFDSPWTADAALAEDVYTQEDGPRTAELFNALMRRHKDVAPNSVVAILSGQITQAYATNLHPLTTAFVEDGLPVMSGGFKDGVHLSAIVPPTMLADLKAMKARRLQEVRRGGGFPIGMLPINCAGIEHCDESAAFPQEVRRFVRTLVEQAGVKKILVGRGAGFAVQVATEALRGSVDTRAANDRAGVSFYCQQRADIATEAPDWVADPGQRASLAERILWEMREDRELYEQESFRFTRAISIGKVNPKDLRLAGDSARRDLATFARDPSLAVASLEDARAIEGFRLAVRTGVPALLLLAGTEPPPQLRDRKDCVFVRLPVTDINSRAGGRAIAVLDVSMVEKLAGLEVERIKGVNIFWTQAEHPEF